MFLATRLYRITFLYFVLSAKRDLFVSEFNYEMILLNLCHSNYCLITFEHNFTLAYIYIYIYIRTYMHTHTYTRGC